MKNRLHLYDDNNYDNNNFKEENEEEDNNNGRTPSYSENKTNNTLI